MYAQLCKRLSREAPNFEPQDKPCTFRLLLLNKCKAEFENRSQNMEQLEQVAGMGGGGGTVEEEERRQLAKRKMLGNIKFIGELAKLEILSENILHRCIQELLLDKKRRGDTPQDISEDLECLCQILRTCGRILDTDKGQQLMRQYFDRMRVLADSSELPPRIRFMLKDVIELREDKWVPRKAISTEGPMPMNQIRPADDDTRSQAYLMQHRRQNNDRDSDRLSNNELFRSSMKMRRGIEDIMVDIRISSSSTNLIPTHGDKFPLNPNGYGGRDNSYRSHRDQRQSYNMYNNQRPNQYNRHNQNNQHSNNNTQFNNSSNKELAPRFKKNLIAAREQNLGDVELRPAANSMLFNQASIKAPPTNMMLNNRNTPELSLNATSKPTPAPLLKEPLPLKQVTTDKPKQTKKDKGPSKDELQKKFNALVEEYLKENSTLEETLESYKENKIQEKHAKDALLSVLNTKLDNKETTCEKFVKLLKSLRSENLMSANVCQEALKSYCNNIDETDSEIDQKKSTLSNLLAQSVSCQILALSEIASITENGMHHPLFLLVLQRLHKTMEKQELTEMFNSAKINMLSQLPEQDRTKERLAEILEDRDLTFLYPLLRIQAELAKQLQADPAPNQFYKWIKDNLEPSNYIDPGFINALMTVLLKYIMAEAGGGALGAAGADAKDKERAILERYTSVLQHFLHERTDLQVTAVYSLQAHCHALGFPKGVLLRWFMALYELEVIEEEAFLQWKEDLTDAYPGKGQALFQVNQWLTWLQEAESEDEDLDD